MIWIVLGSVVGLILVAIGVAYVIGSRLPVGHSVSVSRSLRATPDEVWSVITDIDAMPSWRKELKGIERTAGKDVLPRWVEKSGFGDIPLQAEMMEKPHRLVTRIDDPKLPFGGRWTYELAAEGKETRLKITEDGEVKSPMFRFMSKYIFGHRKTLETYADQLEAKFSGSGRS